MNCSCQQNQTVEYEASRWAYQKGLVVADLVENNNAPSRSPGFWQTYSILFSLFRLLLGPAYDLDFSEVRGHSLVFLWRAPVYTGAGAVTGYFVEMAKKGSSEFVTLNEEPVKHRYLKVSLSG